MIPLRDQQVLRERFQPELGSRVRIDSFTQKPLSVYVPGRSDCAYCEDVRVLMEEVASLSERISLTTHDIDKDKEAVKTFGIDKVPGIVIRGQTNRPIKYYGVPAGTNFPAFVENLLDAARGTVTLSPKTTQQLRKLKSDVHLQVLTTPTCQYSPSVVRTAAKMALQNNRIHLDVVEIAEFPQMAQRYGLRATPTTVVNDEAALPGALDEALLLENIFRIVEGKPITRPQTPLPATAFQIQTSEQQGQPQQTVTASGLIVPGR
jgi:glutaredoxin-like protein